MTPSLHTTVTKEGEAAVVRLEGSVGILQAEQIRQRLDSLAAGGFPRILVDVSATDYAGSLAVAAVAAGCARGRRGEGRIGLLAPRKAVREVLARSKVTRFLPMYSSVRQSEAPGAGAVCGSRIVLRPLAVEDKALLEVWAAEEEIQKTFSKRLLARLIGAMPDVVTDPTRRDLIICDEHGREIGLMDLFDIDRKARQAEMAKLLGDPAARGKGYAKEATDLLLGYAFDELDLRRVHLRTAAFNVHNIKLNEKVGFRLEGILRQADLLGGKLTDVALMSMLKREYLQICRPEDWS